jgi:hypothetical protein
MKTLTNLIAFSATAILLCGSAMAEDLMTAKVPFDFRFGGVNFSAGEYRVDSSHGRLSGLILVQNQHTRQAAVSIGVPNEISRVADYDAPRLVFRCNDSGCVLNQVRTPAEQYTYPVKADKYQHIASVPLTSAKAD